jgi:hypothetical protein
MQHPMEKWKRREECGLARTSHKNLVVAVGPFICVQTEREPSAVQ